MSGTEEALAAPAPAPAPVCGNTIGGRQCLMPQWHHGLCETGLASPAPAPDAREAALQRIRDPRPDWPAIERLVDDAIRRGEITASRGAEILGLRLRTWRDLALEMAAERAAQDAP